MGGFEAWVETAGGSCPLTSQRYAPDLIHPDGATRMVSFVLEPWPTWEMVTTDGVRLRHEIFVQHGGGPTVMTWTVLSGGPATLHVRPLLSGRDYHSMHHENGAFLWVIDPDGNKVELWEPKLWDDKNKK